MGIKPRHIQVGRLKYFYNFVHIFPAFPKTVHTCVDSHMNRESSTVTLQFLCIIPVYHGLGQTICNQIAELAGMCVSQHQYFPGDSSPAQFNSF